MNEQQYRGGLFGAALGLGLAVSLPAAAGNQAMLDLIEVLRDNGTITQDAYEVLRNSVLADEEHRTADQAKIVKAQVQEEVKQAAVETPKVKINTKGKLSIEDTEGEWEWRIGGRIMHDAAFWDDDGAFAEEDGTEFRRARLYMSGKMWRFWKFKFQYDFTDADKDIEGIEDAYIQYTGFKPATIKVGQFKEPFGLELLTSSKYITFMERSMAITALGDSPTFGGRHPGLMFHTSGDNWTAAAGVFATKQQSVVEDVEVEFDVPAGGLTPGTTVTAAGTGGDDEDPARDIDDGCAFTARATFAPIAEKDRVVHLGAAVSYRDLQDGTRFRVRERPEVHISPRTVNTGRFATDDFLRLGLEAAWVQGPFSLQGEYLRLMTSTPSGLPEPDFDGFYVLGSWFVTGESRNYKLSDGAFSGIKPKSPVGYDGGLGAWELGLRYSSLDLNDAGITGGDQENVTVGLNWYPNANIRFMANYVHVLDIDGGPFANAEPSAFTLRSQIHW